MSKGSEKLINKNLRVYATESFYALKEKLEKLLVSKKQLNEAVKKALHSQNLLSKDGFVPELKKGLETLYQNGRIKDKTLRKFAEMGDKITGEST
jgi:predicted nuclease with TOPRIM domain